MSHHDEFQSSAPFYDHVTICRERPGELIFVARVQDAPSAASH